MKIRKLLDKDAPFMLEWMHDAIVVKDLRADFASKTIRDCEQFIEKTQMVKDDLHMAIADDFDEYMGTVSLKHILNETAEFAIAIRACAMGKGFAQFGMQSIFEIGFEDYGLKEIYWCVAPDNIRALRFYDKLGYKRIDIDRNMLSYSEEELRTYIWYSVMRK